MKAVHNRSVQSFWLVETAGINHGKSLATSSGIISIPRTSPAHASLSTSRRAYLQVGEKWNKFCWTQKLPRFAALLGVLKVGKIGQWAVVPEIHRANKHQQLL